ncbi:hypothetical protein AVEN_77427-1 [Araneus ventricosus]|uniref:Uncharacterized protein n=1 Tax=Araneus ventricosus TaxID=182803 RepID=A0A4Y2FUS3_ARAVE|nr:hypothetical protein AVEN_266674-1 [Araneus ventricosus]GBM43433.1 hypothetical protein AVEN_77427-1 [Araneus ventricosus]
MPPCSETLRGISMRKRKLASFESYDFSVLEYRFITGYWPFPYYLFRFRKHPDNCCACGEPGTPIHYATKRRLTLSYHLRCPADQHIEAWMKSVTNHRLLTNKIIGLLNFIISQEDLLKSEQPE